MTENEIKEIYEIIPYGKKSRISKRDLANKLKVNEIELNKIISNIRQYHIILSDNTLGGYWRPNTEKEFKEFICEHKKRMHIENELIKMAQIELINSSNIIERGC